MIENTKIQAPNSCLIEYFSLVKLWVMNHESKAVNLSSEYEK